MNFKLSYFKPSSLGLQPHEDDALHDYKVKQNVLNKVTTITINKNESEAFKEIVTTYTHSPHVFKNGMRKTENFQESHGVILDFDNKGEHNDSTIAEFLESNFAKEFAFILYTSKSHSDLENSFHVFLPLQEPIKDSTSYQELLMLIGWYFKGQDDLRTDRAILADKGNRFIYPSRHNKQAPNFKDFKQIVSLFKENNKGKLVEKNKKPVPKTQLSLGYFLNIPEFKLKLDDYHVKAQKIILGQDLDIRDFDPVNNKVDKIVEEATIFYNENAEDFSEPEWFVIGQSIWNTYGDGGEVVWDEMASNEAHNSRKHITYDTYRERAERGEISNRPVTIATFFYTMEQHGFKGSYSLKEIKEAVRKVTKDANIFLVALHNSLQYRDYLFFITRDIEATKLTLNKVSYIIDREDVENFLDTNDDGIRLETKIATFKYAEFINYVEGIATLESKYKSLLKTYNVMDGDKKVANILFTELTHLLLHAATTDTFSITSVAGLFTSDKQRIRNNYAHKVMSIKDVVDLRIQKGQLLYFNPVLPYPNDMLDLYGDDFDNEAKKRAKIVAMDLLSLLENDKVAFNFMLDFMAQYTFEYRAKANRCSIVVTGVRGSGKNTLFETLIGSIFTTPEIVKRDKKVDSSMFSNLYTKKLAIFDETELNNYELEDELKKIGGATSIPLREMYKTARPFLVYSYAVLLSNNRNVLAVTDDIQEPNLNQWFIKHLEKPLKDKLDNVIDAEYARKYLRSFIDYVLYPRYVQVVKKYNKKYRYGIPVPVTKELINSKRQKVANSYHNIKITLEEIVDLAYAYLDNEDKLALPEHVTREQASYIVDVFLLIHRHVFTPKLIQAITGSKKSTQLENALLQYNIDPSFTLEVQRTSLFHKTYRGYQLTTAIVNNFIPMADLLKLQSVLDKFAVKKIMDYHNII